MIWWEQRTIINKIKEQTQSANSTHRDRESSDSPRFTHTYQHFNVISSPAVVRAGSYLTRGVLNMHMLHMCMHMCMCMCMWC